MQDCLIVGGGVIGLSLAWELATAGLSVQVIDQAEPGREASWAGAGILPPAATSSALHPYDRLRALSSELHPRWAAKLLEATGIDNGYRRCGGIYIARTAGEAAALAAWAGATAAEGIAVERLAAAALGEFEPALMTAHRPPFRGIYRLPAEAQLRNPRHLKALQVACVQAGVVIRPRLGMIGFKHRGDRVIAIETTSGDLSAGTYCITTGAWTARVLEPLGITPKILPMRGQMILFHCPLPPLTHVINEGSRYLVPRDDGYVLAGSTEEEVGFDKRNTEEAIADLSTFACELVSALTTASIERTWAGLRPATLDGMPYLGPLPGLTNAFLAAGHFRSGLYLSPATAVVMSQLIRGERPAIDLRPFHVGR